MSKQRRHYIGGQAPRPPYSVLPSIPSRTKSGLGPVRRTGDIYFRWEDGTPVLFMKAGKIMMHRRRPHWEQSPGMLVPLDMHKGEYYLMGHGRPQ